MIDIETVKPKHRENQGLKKKVESDKCEKRVLDSTLKGVLINNHLKNRTGENYSFSDIQDSLLINNSKKYYMYSRAKENPNSKDSGFDTKKAMTPLLLGTGILALSCYALSACLRKSSGNLLKTQHFEQLPDLAVNMNIREEPQFGIYRAIRNPNFRNIIGAISVFIMSGITIACKNFVDGSKEIWTKKKSADIERELQENLISVERDSFSGKLKVLNDMMNKNVKYFDSVINHKSSENISDTTSFKQEQLLNSNIFKSFTSNFKGRNTENDSKTNKSEKYKYALLIGGVAAAGLLLGKLSLSNLKKTIQNTRTFADNYAENTINAIENISNRANPQEVPGVIELLKSVCAKPEYVKKVGEKYNLSAKEIEEIVEAVNESKKTIFADAPTALGGIPKKVQYYCYIDEPRGHLYNWIVNLENKFTKYIFMAFTLSASIGYLFKQGMDAIKDVAVLKENAKTNLNLKKQLVDVEIQNYKAKKESAINPLVDEFTRQAQSGKKSKQELKQLADNILIEIKNGPPYVYN